MNFKNICKLIYKIKYNYEFRSTKKIVFKRIFAEAIKTTQKHIKRYKFKIIKNII